MKRVAHVVNQFFAGVGGEDKADVAVAALDSLSGPSRGLQRLLQDQAEVASTIYFGDNYFHERPEEARAALLKELAAVEPDVVVLGPVAGWTASGPAQFGLYGPGSASRDPAPATRLCTIGSSPQPAAGHRVDFETALYREPLGALDPRLSKPASHSVDQASSEAFPRVQAFPSRSRRLMPVSAE